MKCAQRNGIKCHETQRANSTENDSKIKTLLVVIKDYESAVDAV